MEGQVRRRGLGHSREVRRHPSLGDWCQQSRFCCRGRGVRGPDASPSIGRDPRTSIGALDMTSSAHVLAAPESVPVVEDDIRPGSRLLRPFEIVSSILLVAVVVLLLAGVISRYVFSLSVVWIDEVASLCFLWLAMLGSAIALDRNEHLRLTLFLHMLPERAQRFVEAFGLLVIATFLLSLVPPAFDYAMEEWYITTPALEIPNTFRAAAIPFGMVAMLGIVVAHAIRTSTW